MFFYRLFAGKCLLPTTTYYLPPSGCMHYHTGAWQNAHLLLPRGRRTILPFPRQTPWHCRHFISVSLYLTFLPSYVTFHCDVGRCLSYYGLPPPFPSLQHYFTAPATSPYLACWPLICPHAHTYIPPYHHLDTDKYRQGSALSPTFALLSCATAFLTTSTFTMQFRYPARLPCYPCNLLWDGREKKAEAQGAAAAAAM